MKATILESPPVVQQKTTQNETVGNSIPSIQGQKPPIQAKGFNGKPLQPIQTKSKPPVQAKTAWGEAQTTIQRKPNDTGLPDNLKSGIENLSGYSMDDVKVHYNSDKPAQLQAHAYAQGTDIHVASGQEKHLPHEAWHVVQQKQGRVQATTQMKGVGVNDNSALEKEADVMGDKALNSQATATQQPTNASTNHTLKTVQTKSKVAQLIKTSGGKWVTGKYELRKDKNAYGKKIDKSRGVRGVDMKLKFQPNQTVDATKIGLVQSVQCYVDGSPSFTDDHKKNERSIPSKDSSSLDTGKGETNEGTSIDRVSKRNNPIYGSDNLTDKQGLEDTPMDNNRTKEPTRVGLGKTFWGKDYNATYQLGYRYQDGKTLRKQNAKLYDGPTRGGASKNSRHVFETTAVAIDGKQKGTYYGSVRWGWRTDSKGKFTKIPFQVVSQGTPSETFQKASEIWGKSTDNKGNKSKPLPDFKKEEE